jgi:hypothetical protein
MACVSSLCGGVTKVEGPAQIAALQDHHWRSRTQCSFAAASLAHGQPLLLLVQPIKLLAIELDDQALELFIARPLCRIAVRLWMQADEPTGSRLRGDGGVGPRGPLMLFRSLFSKFDWYEVANFARRDKIFCDVFSICHDLAAHNAEHAFLIRIEHARPGISRAGNICNQGVKFVTKRKRQDLRRNDVRSRRSCLIHNDDWVSWPRRSLT